MGNADKVVVEAKPLIKSKTAWGNASLILLLGKVLAAKFGIVDPTIIPDVVEAVVGIGGSVLSLWGLLSKNRAPIKGIVVQ